MDNAFNCFNRAASIYAELRPTHKKDPLLTTTTPIFQEKLLMIMFNEVKESEKKNRGGRGQRRK